MSEAIIEIKNVNKSYDEKPIVKNLSLTINKGEFVTLLGPSGCGKTTILSLISGLLKPTSGTITIGNTSTSDGTTPYIGYMFQHDQLFEWRTIYKNVTLGLEITHTKNPQTIAYIDSLLKKYGLWEFKDKHPSELSGGMRQRVALIRTLALKPKILLLDEAFSALDFQTRLNVCDDIYGILKAEGVTSVLVTHDITEAITMSDKIIVLTSRPAHVKNIHYLPFDPSITPLQRREDPAVGQLFDTIWKDLNNE